MIPLNYETAALRICVDRLEKGCLSGRVLGRRLTREASFSDVGGLLLQIEGVLDAQNSPQAFQKGRTFLAGRSQSPHAARCLEEGMSAETVQAARGRLATFSLQIITRRNATWQGTVDWLDGTSPQPFSSALELIKEIDSRLCR